MSNEQQELEDLIMAAAQTKDEFATGRLLAKIKGCDPKILKEAAEGFDLLFESWSESPMADDKAGLCLILAECGALESGVFRGVLHDAVKYLLPPYISSSGIAKAIGARDQGLTVGTVASRLKKLQKITTGTIVYQLESRCWGRITNIDKVVATLVVNTLATNSQISIPVATALSGCLFFDPHMNVAEIMSVNRNYLKPAQYYCSMLSKGSVGGLSDGKVKELLFSLFVGTVHTEADFEKWWSEASVSGSVHGQRQFQDARSILELYTLLEQKDCESVRVDESAAAKLEHLLNHVRPTSSKDFTMLAECISKLSGAGGVEILKGMFSSLRGKVPFFPNAIDKSLKLKQLEVWGHISAKELPGFIKAASLLYSELELAKLALKLPQRCISQVFEMLSDDDIIDAVFTDDNLSSDLLLTIWKSKAKMPSELLEFLTMQNVSRALSEEGLPKEWSAAQRELKKHLFDKAEFQMFIIKAAGANIPGFIYAIQKMRNMLPGECQSLLVKLSRHSPELKDQIESGEGRKLLAGRSGEQDEKKSDGAAMTSLASLRRLQAELDDIVHVQTPENNKAIEHARGFGDFRENAEYDAAKERRRFLQRRRNELENLVATIQPINFAEFKPDTEKASLGTVIELKTSAGNVVYSLVGAWDGVPDRNLVSYKTKLGASLLGVEKGDKLKLPDGTEAEVLAIKPLPDDLINELSSEE